MFFSFAAPSVPANVKSSLIHPNGYQGPQLIITSDLPREPNGEIRKFILRYFYNNTYDNAEKKEAVPVTKPTANFRFPVNIKTTGTLIYELSAFTIKEGPRQHGYATIPAFRKYAILILSFQKSFFAKGHEKQSSAFMKPIA